MHTNKQVLFLFVRYLFLLLISWNSLWLIYLIVTPLTVQTSLFFIQQFYINATLLGNTTIFFKGYYASLVPACIAGAAYYLLLILNFATPMSAKKRLFAVLITMVGFFIANTARIVIFAVLFEQGYKYFDLTHQLTWYLGSTLLVVILWFLTIFILKIKEIPGYTDLKSLYSWKKELEHVR